VFKRFKRLVFLATMAVAAAALYEQLKRPPEDRSWRGTVLGVPYDFRPPSLSRFMDAWWNPDSDRLFQPRDFGVGWAVNLHRVYRMVRDRNRQEQSEDSKLEAQGF
jgi:hypothetical protein